MNFFDGYFPMLGYQQQQFYQYSQQQQQQQQLQSTSYPNYYQQPNYYNVDIIIYIIFISIFKKWKIF
jgi:hypothetical protein